MWEYLKECGVALTSPHLLGLYAYYLSFLCTGLILLKASKGPRKEVIRGHIISKSLWENRCVIDTGAGKFNIAMNDEEYSRCEVGEYVHVKVFDDKPARVRKLRGTKENL